MQNEAGCALSKQFDCTPVRPPTVTRLKSPLALAFVGDAVYELLVRRHIADSLDTNVNRLHRMTVDYVCAAGQSRALALIQDQLTDEERDIVRRGRNATKTAIPRNGNPREYRSATGIEALFGYLYCEDRQARIAELFTIIFDGTAAQADATELEKIL